MQTDLLTSSAIRSALSDYEQRTKALFSSIEKLKEANYGLFVRPDLELLTLAESCKVQENLIATDLGEAFVLATNIRIFRNRLVKTKKFLASSPYIYEDVPSEEEIRDALDRTEEKVVALYNLLESLQFERLNVERLVGI